MAEDLLLIDIRLRRELEEQLEELRGAPAHSDAEIDAALALLMEQGRVVRIEGEGEDEAVYVGGRWRQGLIIQEHENAINKNELRRTTRGVRAVCGLAGISLLD
jgi:hypothetical protein